MLEELWLKFQEIIPVALRSFQELSRAKRIVLLVCIVALIPGYFIAKYSSFAFWNLQYRQYVVVAAPAFQTSEEVVVDPVTIIANGNNSYTAYAKIKNPHLDLAFQDGVYELTFLNSTNETVRTQRGGLFLLPDQEKYIVATVSTTEPIATARIELSGINWQKKASIPQVPIRAPQPDTYEDLNPLQFVAEGLVVNESPYRLGTVRITFLLYNASNEIIAISERSEFSVRSQERRAYVQRWPNMYTSEVARVEVRTETNALSGNNLILEDLPSSEGSDLGRPESDFF